MRRLDQLGRAARMLGLYRSWPRAYRNRLARGPRTGEVVYELRNGITVAMDAGPADVRVLNEVWLDRVYEPRASFRPQPGWTVLDIGAHKGSFALLAASAGPGTTVHAYEPSPANLAQLRRNAEANDLALHVHACAVAAERGRGVLAFSAGAAHRGSLVLERGYEQHEQVETVTLDDAVAAAGGEVELVKMDIEGSELGALRGASAAGLAGVRRLVVECHADGEHSTDEVAGEIVGLLRSHGFDAEYRRERQLVHAERPS